MRRLARLVIALAVIAGVFAFVRWWDFTVSMPFEARYQAVFLVNGQTYFGQYRDRIGPYAKIDNVFYLQQQPAAEGQPAETRIVRRGDELHEPFPSLLVPKTSILFVEDLESGSSIGQFMDQALRR